MAHRRLPHSPEAVRGEDGALDVAREYLPLDFLAVQVTLQEPLHVLAFRLGDVGIVVDCGARHDATQLVVQHHAVALATLSRGGRVDRLRLELCTAHRGSHCREEHRQVVSLGELVVAHGGHTVGTTAHVVVVSVGCAP